MTETMFQRPHCSVK